MKAKEHPEISNMSKEPLSEPSLEPFSLEISSPRVPPPKPRILIKITASSPTLSLSDTSNPFTINLTVELKYQREIVIHSLDNIFQTFPSKGRGLEKYLDFIALTPLEDDILASGHMYQKKGMAPKEKEREDRGGPIVCYWADQDDFHNLMPKRPQVVKLKLGPWYTEPGQTGFISAVPTRIEDRDGRWYNTMRQKDKDGRWICDSPAIIPSKATQNLENITQTEEGEQKQKQKAHHCDLEGVEYEIRLKRGMFVKWWKKGEKDDYLTIYKREGNWFAEMLGMKRFRRWKGEEVLGEIEWIEIEMEGEVASSLTTKPVIISQYL